MSPATKPSRAHHYIPRFHLCGFAPDRGRRRARMLYRYDKSRDRIDYLSVDRAAVVNDYFTLPSGLGHDPEALERLFAALEGGVAPVIQWMRTLSRPGHYSISPETRDALAGYVAILQMRSPTYRDIAWRRIGLLTSIDLDMLLSDRERFLALAREQGDRRTDDELEAYRLSELDDFRSGRLSIEPQQAHSLQDLGIGVDVVRPEVIRMRWRLLRRDVWPSFVIGEQPVTLLGAHGEIGELGWANDVDALVPLSPNAVLAMDHHGTAEGFDVLTLDGAPAMLTGSAWWHALNRAAWMTASRFVYARSAADLSAVYYALSNEERQAGLPGLTYGGGDPAWEQYARQFGITRRRTDEDWPDDLMHLAGPSGG